MILRVYPFLKDQVPAHCMDHRAGNGVVLITTKSGKGLKKMTVSFTSNVVFEKPYKFLNWQTKYGSGQFSAIPVELTGNPLNGSVWRIDPGKCRCEPLAVNSTRVTMRFNGIVQKMTTEIQLPTPLISHANNVKNFVQTGITATNGVSVAGNTEMINYRVSYANMTNKGIIPGSDLFRNTLNINSSLKVSNRCG